MAYLFNIFFTVRLLRRLWTLRRCGNGRRSFKSWMHAQLVQRTVHGSDLKWLKISLIFFLEDPKGLHIIILRRESFGYDDTPQVTH